MISPKPLFPGARVALVGASSAVPAQRLEPALEAVRALGLDPVPYPSCYEENRHGYLAASDQQRADDLNAAFADDTIHGILAIRGGYGAHRLLPLLDWETIRAHPKRFAGYSDVTALHTALNQNCRMVTYHTIMPSTEYYQPVDECSMDYLRRALFGGLTGPLSFPEGCRPETFSGGRATGILCGGNLSLLTASLGTPWEIDTRGKILFLEDVGEQTYRLDGMLTQLRNAGKFRDCAGILLGYWTDCPPEDPERTIPLKDIFRELLPAGKPILSDLPCGHSLPSIALPLGATLAMDADARTLEVLSTAKEHDPV